jgi:hypothetical protein
MARKLTDAERWEQIRRVQIGRAMADPSMPTSQPSLRQRQEVGMPALGPTGEPMTAEEYADLIGIKRPAPQTLQETQGATNTEADLTAVQNQPPSVNVNVDVDVSARESPRQVTHKGFLGRAFCWHDWSDYELSPQSGRVFRQCYKCSKMDFGSGLF